MKLSKDLCLECSTCAIFLSSSLTVSMIAYTGRHGKCLGIWIIHTVLCVSSVAYSSRLSLSDEKLVQCSNSFHTADWAFWLNLERSVPTISKVLFCTPITRCPPPYWQWRQHTKWHRSFHLRQRSFWDYSFFPFAASILLWKLTEQVLLEFFWGHDSIHSII